MTPVDYTPTYFGIFLSLGLLIVNIFALIIVRFSFVLILVLVFSFLLVAFLLFHLVLVLLFNKLNFAIHFLLLFLGGCFCFIDDRSTEATIFQVSWTDIEIVLLLC